METKKAQHADINKQRSGFFQIGLLIAGAITLSAFEYTQFSKQEQLFTAVPGEIVDIEIPIYEQPEKPKVQPPQERERTNNTRSSNTSAAVATSIATTTNAVDPNQSLLGMDGDSVVLTDLGGGNAEPIIEGEFTIVEEMPYCAECAHYPTSLERFQCTRVFLQKKMQKDIRYPKDAVMADASGTVEISFRINKSGEMEDIKIERSVFPSIDREAKRVVSLLPKLTPGEQRGQKVNVRYKTSLKFELK
ncbi:MAG: energy transducer TonB [Flavobacteriales bacterium]